MCARSDKWLQILIDKVLPVPPRFQDYGRALLDAAKDLVAPLSSKARIVAPLARPAYTKYMTLIAPPRASLAIPDATFAPVDDQKAAASMAVQSFPLSDAQTSEICGMFRTVAEARTFAYAAEDAGYDLTVTVTSTGERASVNIAKPDAPAEADVIERRELFARWAKELKEFYGPEVKRDTVEH